MTPYLFRLPDLGEGTAEAEIVAWRVQPGDLVVEDQLLVEIMTDKATVEITSPVSGRIVSLRGAAGDMAPVGATLVEFALQGDAPDASAPSIPAPPNPAPPADTSRAPAFFQTEQGPADADKPLASPAVRRRARESGIALSAVAGTGPSGRVTREDLERHVAKPAAPAPRVQGPGLGRREGVEEIRIVGLRRKIAEKMLAAKRNIPHFAYIEEVDVTELEDLRLHLNATKAAERPKLTLLPFLITALTRTLPDFPQINATYDDQAGMLSRHAAVHLGMAVQTPNGLIVPVIRHTEARDIWDLAAEIARLAKAARDGTAKRDELSGSTLTLTSLGPLGGIAHTPVINAPEVAIVGPNKIVERPVVRHGQIVVRKMMNLSASFDHRIVDGHDAAAFIQAVKARLEYPATLFLA
jgi:2-oxoisovalerate dehydrogenase E2 component (dihydrolipoyl transacylase)